MIEEQKHWAVDRVVEASLDLLYARLDDLVSDGDLTEAEVLDTLRYGWSIDIADGYEEWIRG